MIMIYDDSNRFIENVKSINKGVQHDSGIFI